MLRSAEHTLHTCKRRAVPPHILPPVFRFNLISIRLASSTPFPWTPENVREHGTVSPPLPLERTNAKRPLEAIEAALKLPVPTSFPESKDKRLRQLLLDNKDESDGQCDEFRSSYSPRRLEWLGDRIFGEIAAETLFVLAPRVVKVTQSSSRAEFITTHQDIVSIETNAKLAIELKLTGVFTAAADRWEAYLAALCFSNGRDAVIKFLVPFVKREFFILHPALRELYVEQGSATFAPSAPAPSPPAPSPPTPCPPPLSPPPPSAPSPTPSKKAQQAKTAVTNTTPSKAPKSKSPKPPTVAAAPVPSIKSKDVKVTAKATSTPAKLSPAAGHPRRAGVPLDAVEERTLLRRAKKLDPLVFASAEDAEQNLIARLQELKATFSFRRIGRGHLLRLPGYPTIGAPAKKGEITLSSLVKACIAAGAVTVPSTKPKTVSTATKTVTVAAAAIVKPPVTRKQKKKASKPSPPLSSSPPVSPASEV